MAETNEGGGIHVGANFTNIGIANTNVIKGNVSNVVHEVNQSPASENVKDLVAQLGEEIKKAVPDVDTGTAERLDKDFETLGKEAEKEKPDRRYCQFSLEGIKEAAAAIGEIGKPIIETVSQLMPLLVG